MINIKLSGSLIAPKKTDIFDQKYLKDFNIFCAKNFENFVLHHGTGNVGHGFVEKYGLGEETIHIGRKNLREYFEKIDKFFGLQRISAQDFLNSDLEKGKYIVGGDISNERKIISSDKTFAFGVQNSDQKIHFILADIQGVKNENNQIIKNINNQNLEQIKFWKKEGDVSGGMEGKIKELKNIKGKTIWLVDGKNFDNIEKILKTGDGIGTKIEF